MAEALAEIQADLSALKRHGDDQAARRRVVDAESVEATARIMSALSKFKRKYKVTGTRDLVGNQELYMFVQSEIDAPRYFPSYLAFEEAVRVVLKGV